MTKQEIKEVLVRRDYDEKTAELVANDLMSVDLCLLEPLEMWLNEEIETDIVIKDISLLQLMRDKKLNYPASILTLDWIIKDPGEAIPVVFQDIL